MDISEGLWLMRSWMRKLIASSALTVKLFRNSSTLAGSALVFFPSLSFTEPSSSIWKRRFSRRILFTLQAHLKDAAGSHEHFAALCGLAGLLDLGPDAVVQEVDLGTQHCADPPD
jgi:hypothetical protein